LNGITISPDAVADGSRTITATVGGGLPGWDSFTATIGEPDESPPPPMVGITAIDPDASHEGPSSGTFRIVRGGDTSAPLTVYYTVGGTATPNVDYGAIADTTTNVGHVTILAGETSAALPVDPNFEFSPGQLYQSVSVTLEEPPDWDDTGDTPPPYVIGNSDAQVTISPVVEHSNVTGPKAVPGNSTYSSVVTFPQTEQGTIQEGTWSVQVVRDDGTVVPATADDETISETGYISIKGSTLVKGQYVSITFKNKPNAFRISLRAFGKSDTFGTIAAH
jgi:hypothetical protein